MISRESVFLTGATGLIGGELLRLLLRDGAAHVSALVRAASRSDAEYRVIERMHRGGANGVEAADDRLAAMPGDLSAEGLGLSEADRRSLTAGVDTIIHCAAETSFIRDENCNRINIGGMAGLIDFARQCRREPLIVHISTSTVCGAIHDACVGEEFRCDPDGEHYNEYTRSKAMAERMLRESGLEFVILRPSIVVSAGLRDPAFAKAILWWLPLLNQLEAVPMDPEARLDMVTVSYVTQAILGVIRSECRRHDCYHISAGRDDATTIGQAGRFLDSHYERPRRLRLVPPGQWTRDLHRRYVRTPDQRKVMSSLRHYLPFINMNVTYDNGRLRQLLDGDMPDVPPFESYAGSMLELMSPELMTEM